MLSPFRRFYQICLFLCQSSHNLRLRFQQLTTHIHHHNRDYHNNLDAVKLLIEMNADTNNSEISGSRDFDWYRQSNIDMKIWANTTDLIYNNTYRDNQVYYSTTRTRVNRNLITTHIC